MCLKDTLRKIEFSCPIAKVQTKDFGGYIITKTYYYE